MGMRFIEMIQEVRATMANVQSLYPDYDGSGCELAGLVWFQGFNDVISDTYRAHTLNRRQRQQRLRLSASIPWCSRSRAGPYTWTPNCSRVSTA